jgi:bifunctional non-homologous end joining protein LigD
MPLAWEELSPEIGPAYFTIRNAPARLSSVADPWADFRAAAAPIEGDGKKAKPARKR